MSHQIHVVTAKFTKHITIMGSPLFFWTLSSDRVLCFVTVCMSLPANAPHSASVALTEKLIAYQREFHALKERLRVAEHRTLQRSSELNNILEQFRRAIAETNNSKDALTNFSGNRQMLKQTQTDSLIAFVSKETLGRGSSLRVLSFLEKTEMKHVFYVCFHCGSVSPSFLCVKSVFINP